MLERPIQAIEAIDDGGVENGEEQTGYFLAG